MPEEILDLVNERDEVIGSMSRREIYEKGLRNFRVIHAFLVNKAGKLWIPRRTAHKKICPNGLDFSVAGHVESGESYDEAFRRETREEIGIDVDAVGWRTLGKFTHADGAHFFEQAYEIHFDQDPNYNPHDFSEAHWYTRKEVYELIAKGGPMKFDLEFTLRHFYPA